MQKQKKRKAGRYYDSNTGISTSFVFDVLFASLRVEHVFLELRKITLETINQQYFSLTNR